jgi:hypothetical protein
MAQKNHPQRYQRKQSVDEISMIEDVLRLYNTVAKAAGRALLEREPGHAI